MENFRIESLEINKIGAFEHIKMDFPKKTDPDKAEIHILTGENGTGKSTILECLAYSTFIKGFENKLLRKFHDYDNCSYNIDYNNNNSIKIARHEEELYHSGIQPFLKKIFENLYNSEKPEHRTIAEVNFSLFAYSGYRRTQEVKISGINEINESPFKDCLNFDKSINTENLQQWIFNTDYRMLSALRSKDEIASKNIYENITLIQAILTLIIEQDLILEISPKDFKLNIVLSANSTNQNIVPFENLPDGLKSMISWIGDLLMRMDRIKWKDDLPIFERNFILFLDEIEVHLHPAWQRKILPVVQKLFKNAQIFISTHSPFVVGSVDGAWVHKLKKDGAFAVLDGEPVLSEDGKSVRRILDETFGINQQYGVEVEKDLEKFREIRQKIMQGYEYNLDEFNKLVKHLASQSTELEQMMGMEMNQLKRITQTELV